VNNNNSGDQLKLPKIKIKNSCFPPIDSIPRRRFQGNIAWDKKINKLKKKKKMKS